MSNVSRVGIAGAAVAAAVVGLLLAQGSVATTPLPAAPAAPPTEVPDLTSQPIATLAVGTAVVAGQAPKDWSHLVLHATPTLAGKDAEAAPELAAKFARMFRYTLVAHVARPKGEPNFALEKVAHGFAVEATGGNEIVVSGKDSRGSELGLIGRQILDENERVVAEDVRQVVRTKTMLLFDAKCTMLRKDEHEAMVMRHAVVVDPATGALRCAIWLLAKDFTLAEKQLQVMGPSAEEQRLLSVKKDEFRLGLPSRKAFALRQVPPGTPVAFTEALLATAGTKKFTAESALALQQALAAVLK